MATVKSNGVEDYIDAIHLFRHGVDVLFFLVNANYICLIWELIDRAPVDGVSPAVRRIMRFRSITTLCLIGVAALVALKYPLAELGICICCLIVYLKPNPPGAGQQISQR